MTLLAAAVGVVVPVLSTFTGVVGSVPGFAAATGGPPVGGPVGAPGTGVGKAPGFPVTGGYAGVVGT